MAKPLSLWIVNQYALPPDQAGITRNFSLAEKMLEANVESLIIASPTNYLSRRRNRNAAAKSVDRTRVVPFIWITAPSYRSNGLTRVLNMMAFAVGAVMKPLILLGRRRIAAPDLVLGSSPNLFAGLSAWALASILRTPFVLEIRDLHPLSITMLAGTPRNHPYVRLLALIEKFLYRRASLIISPLQGAGEHVRKTIGTERPWFWLPNSVDTEKIPTPDPVRTAPVPFKFVYAGAHGVANGLDVLVDAAALLRHEPILFVLYGDGIDKQALRQRAADQNLNNIIFADPVPKTVIYQRLSEADALVFLLADHPLWDHGLSANKLYDYLACARPILMAAKSQYDPVAEAKAGVTVKPASPSALAAGALQLVALSTEERQTMGDRGRTYVRRNYNLPDLAAALADRLKALL